MSSKVNLKTFARGDILCRYKRADLKVVDIYESPEKRKDGRYMTIAVRPYLLGYPSGKGPVIIDIPMDSLTVEEVKFKVLYKVKEERIFR